MSQREQVKSHLKSLGSITPMAALNHYGIMRLGARIYELRQDGMKIETELIESPRTGNKYARYIYKGERT